MFNKLKQIKDLRDKAKEMQDALSEEKIEGSADWGKVKIVMDGNMKVTGVTIDPSLLATKEKLEQDIAEAFNDAMARMQKVMAEKMKNMGGLEALGDLLKQ